MWLGDKWMLIEKKKCSVSAKGIKLTRSLSVSGGLLGNTVSLLFSTTYSLLAKVACVLSVAVLLRLGDLLWTIVTEQRKKPE